MTNQIDRTPTADVRIAWSKDNEFFTCDALDELLDMHDDLTIGDVVHFGEVSPPKQRHLCDADDVLDMMADRAYEQCGEVADGYPYDSVNDEGKAALNELLTEWIEKHAKPTFYSVINVREHVITEADMEGRE
ncbi:hypothetical protein WL14_21010 [Burkholderia cepacia]|uniref:hypothetical protein n=1 Tax=Burkholderia cepacia TaxID=292 RepID=UPI0007604E1D|nr:hypothetical protein [Burkholderia cepacia]KVZ22363.1 hypothetical protein WL14_21010 [Burkholderia cepacia]